MKLLIFSSTYAPKIIKTTLSLLAVFFVLMCTTANTEKTFNRRTIENTLREIENVSLPEIERLFNICRENGIALDYEMVDYSVIKDFIIYVRDDMLHRDMERAAYGLNCLLDFRDKLFISLNGYIAGTKKPWNVTRYITGQVEIRGGSLIGEAADSVTGEKITRPLFFSGYGHFDQIIKDMPKMTGYGVDILQTEIGPRDTVIEQGQGYGFNAQGEAIVKIENILREAEINNVRVDVLLSPHYFPEWVFRKFPYLRKNTGGFITFNIYEQEAKKVIETHIIGVLERIKNYKSLNSVCLSNEPVFSIAMNFNVKNKNSAINVMWREYLTYIHGNIGTLNGIYKTNYKSFDLVPMPRGIEASPLFYDWMTFNNLAFSEWHRWMAELINKAAPGLPVHSKIMDAVLSPTGGRASLLWGIDAEQFARFSQFNGNDSYNLLFSNDARITSKMKWYDLLTSIKKMPVFNSEDHIIQDRDRKYIPRQAVHARSDLWQGAVHGRTASTIWIWERTYEKNSDFAGSVLHRPDVVSALGKTNLDLNRLAHELTALQDEPARVAILFSHPSRIYDEAYLSTVDKFYNSLIFNGQKTGFLTEKQLADGAFKNYSLIIVPQAVHVTLSTLSAIRKFIENAGKVLIAGDASLSRDHYDRVITGEDRNFIIENSFILKDTQSRTEQDIADNVRNILAQNNLQTVTLRDSNTGAPVYGIEWQCAQYGGKILINICNYDWNGGKTTAIFIGERPVVNAAELISGKTVNAGNLELVPFTPVLLCVDF